MAKFLGLDCDLDRERDLFLAPPLCAPTWGRRRLGLPSPGLDLRGRDLDFLDFLDFGLFCLGRRDLFLDLDVGDDEDELLLRLRFTFPLSLDGEDFLGEW